MKKQITALSLSLLLLGSLNACHTKADVPLEVSLETTAATEAAAPLLKATEPAITEPSKEVQLFSPAAEESTTKPTTSQASKSETKATTPSTPDHQKEVSVSPTTPAEPEATISKFQPTVPTESKPVVPTVPPITEKQPEATTPTTAPAPTTPPATEATEPPPPPATECPHNWQAIEHSETGHNETYHICGCGFRFNDISAYDAHVAGFAGTAEQFTIHGHWGSVNNWIVDAPSYTEWVCSLCGAARTS